MYRLRVLNEEIEGMDGIYFIDRQNVRFKTLFSSKYKNIFPTEVVKKILT